MDGVPDWIHYHTNCIIVCANERISECLCVVRAYLHAYTVGLAPL